MTEETPIPGLKLNPVKLFLEGKWVYALWLLAAAEWLELLK